jgi:hypothetical protein
MSITLITLTLGCLSSDLPPPPGPPAGDGSNPDADTADSAADTGDGEQEAQGEPVYPAAGYVGGWPPADTSPPEDSGGPLEPRCPAEMAAVYEVEGTILYCVDRYEVLVTGELGDRDQYSEGAELATATAASLAGVAPTTAITYGQADTVCANTPVLDREGEIVGYKHLVTFDEWQDAADGTIGEGGYAYPYGDDFVDGACACANQEGVVVYEGVQPTGSFKRCVSVFGAYDQSGNAWEWVDPQQAIDIAGWWVYGEALGLADTGGYLSVPSGELLEDLSVNAAGVSPTTLDIDEENFLTVEADTSSWDYNAGNPTGYLDYLTGSDEIPRVSLPVEADRDAALSSDRARLRIMTERDGQPITAKVGGAYYTSVDTCRLTEQPFTGHQHDFDGTIGFRCASPPISEAAK